MTHSDSAAKQAGDTAADVIEVHVSDLRELFNPIDPAPVRERDLDPRIEAFIVEWARDVPRRSPLSLLVRVGQKADGPDEALLVSDAVHGFFAARAQSSRLRLRRLFEVGRTSLAVGLPVLVVFTAVAQFLAARATTAFGQVLHESLSIGGWVAMWRPLEIFLYDWWPIRAEAKRYDRLAAIPVRVSYDAGPPPGRSSPRSIPARS